MLGHEEIRAMITALGCGIGKDDFDAAKVRYGKIILMTDADVDGSHIRTLLLTFFFRHMTDLIKRDHVYIAQPPLYKIKKGRFEQYIKDDREFVKVMVNRAAEGMIVRHGETAGKIEGADLTRFMSTLNEYLGFVEKVDKRIRNEKLTEMLARAELTQRADFASKEGKGAPEKITALYKRLVELADDFQFKRVDKPLEDEEHHTWSIKVVDSQGAERNINWELASSPEFRQMMAKYSLIKEFLEPRFSSSSRPRAQPLLPRTKKKRQPKPQKAPRPKPNPKRTPNQKAAPRARFASRSRSKPPAISSPTSSSRARKTIKSSATKASEK